MLVTSDFIVLGSTPYRESALLLRGASPDYGRLSGVLHRAQLASGSDFPVAGLFRELSVEFDDGAGKTPTPESTLYTFGRAELLGEFDALGETPRHYRMAARIGEFLLKNLPENLPQPYTYDALKAVLGQLAAPESPERWSLEQCSVVLKCTYLYENGLLPDGATGEQNQFLEELVAAGVENTGLPQCDPRYWSKLNQWLNSLLEFHHLAR